MKGRHCGVALAMALAACSRGASDRAGPAPPNATPSRASAALIAARPYVLRAPPTHDARAPLVVLLHGYGSNHADAELTLGAPIADDHGAYVALPDGTRDSRGMRFWNATDVCCDFEGTAVDDVAYIDAVLDDAMARAPIDPARVYVVGFSNGGFMAHRYACDRAARVAAVVSIAGAGWNDRSKCSPAAPVSVLQVHGDADTTVRFEGGDLAAAFPGVGHTVYPGARRTVDDWARRDGCTGAPLVTDGAEALDVRYGRCAGHSDVELWALHGAGHQIPIGLAAIDKAWGFLSAHARR